MPYGNDVDITGRHDDHDDGSLACLMRQKDQDPYCCMQRRLHAT